MKWFRLAADQESDKSLYMVGVAYWNGQGVEEDKTEAIKWYRLAAKQGHEDSIKFLSNL